jgi:hypothetical protein
MLQPVPGGCCDTSSTLIDMGVCFHSAGRDPVRRNGMGGFLAVVKRRCSMHLPRVRDVFRIFESRCTRAPVSDVLVRL